MTDTAETAAGRAPNVRRAALGASVLIALGLAGALYAPEPLTDHLAGLKDDAAAERRADRLLAMLADAERSFREREAGLGDQTALARFAVGAEPERVALLDADGAAFWSTDPGEIGRRVADPAFGEALARGATASRLEAGPGDALRRVSYVPVSFAGERVGAVAFAKDVTDARAAMLRSVSLALAGLATVGAVVSVALIQMVNRAAQARETMLATLAARERAALETDRRVTREARLLSELNEWLQASRSLDELFEMVRTFMGRLLPDCPGALYVYSNSRDVLDGACAWSGGALAAHIRPEDCWGLRRGRSYLFGEHEFDLVCPHGREDGGAAAASERSLCAPILAHGETVGLMTLRAPADMNGEAFAAAARLAQLCAEQISLAVANVRLRDQLHDRSIRDPLTGLYNRRHLVEGLRRALDAARRSGAPVSLVAIDVDHFKKFNDNFGHDAGDMVLRAVGSALAQLCDGDELACRTGGEELMALLPGATPEEAAARAEEMRRAVERITVRYGDRALPHVTASFGVAGFPEHGAEPQALITVSDQALYEAKALGRNQVVVARSSGRGSPPGSGAGSGEAAAQAGGSPAGRDAA